MTDWETQYERMVDGELTDAEERKLLLHCEESGSWRELALSYVEQQAFSREMPGVLVRTPDDNVLSKQTSSATAKSSATVKPKAAKPSQQAQESWGLWSLAAAVLLALGLGYGAGWNWRPQESPSIPYPNAIADQDSRSTNSVPTTMQWMVSHPNSNELQQIEIPIMEGNSSLSWQEHLKPRHDRELLDEMRSQGLNLQYQQTLTPVRLQNGQRVIVPVEYFYETPFQ